jgi:hypothetical protein
MAAGAMVGIGVWADRLAARIATNVANTKNRKCFIMHRPPAEIKRRDRPDEFGPERYRFPRPNNPFQRIHRYDRPVNSNGKFGTSVKIVNIVAGGNLWPTKGDRAASRTGRIRDGVK